MAAGQYNDNSVDSQSYLVAPDMNPGLYDGTSSDSSASSPMNCNSFDNMYTSNGFMNYAAFPMQYPMSGDGMTPMGLIPVELDIEGLYEDHDRRRRKNGTEKSISSHVHSRRRAQNRASQRAFRDRKEKHMRELEQRLGELEGRHSDLSRSYESLQLEYASVQQELDKIRKQNSRPEVSTRDYQSREWEESKAEILDPLLFDVSAFCFDQDDGHDRKE
ncbi:related to AP-1-like transcription factor [Rhynchosporium agropyri]|uniref:Putative transcription factor kapC n=1 Tax=Rhynchosporium agropyri TaxID=914238 RepID=A0A1E1KKC9_9HELO|nr:related to AP-1-like transcription factor [Rhynchosporium agropyri]